MGTEPAVLFFQWRPCDERDEITEATAILKAEQKRGDKGRARGVLPLIAEHTCLSDDPAQFAAELERELAKLPALQVLYLSAHGLDDAIARDRKGLAKLDFNNLRPVLGRALDKASRVTVVFGLCYALSPRSFLTSILPPAVVEAYGFTATPEGTDVAALIAGVLADEVTLMASASKEKLALFGKGIPLSEAGPVFEELKRRLDAAVDEYERTHEPEFFVAGSKGASVRRIRRKDDGTWETVMSVAVPGQGADALAEAGAGEEPAEDDRGTA
jgi:hypothetical protein